MVGVGAHERPPLVEVKVENVVDVCHYGDFVLHIVLVQSHAISVNHRRRNFLLLEKLPAIASLLEIIGVKA